MNIINLVKFDFCYHIFKKPAILFYLYIFPLVIFVLFSYLMKSQFTSDVSSADYYGLSIMIYFQLSMGTMVSNMIMEENVKLPNMRIAYALYSETAIYISKIIAILFADAIAIIFYMVVAQHFFDVEFGVNNVGVFIEYLILGFFSICLGACLCIVMNDESSCNNILGVMQLTLCLLGGVFFPVENLGRVGEQLSNISIIKWIYLGLVQMVYCNKYDLVILVNVCALFISIGLLLVTRKSFKIELIL